VTFVSLVTLDLSIDVYLFNVFIYDVSKLPFIATAISFYDDNMDNSADLNPSSSELNNVGANFQLPLYVFHNTL